MLQTKNQEINAGNFYEECVTLPQVGNVCCAIEGCSAAQHHIVPAPAKTSGEIRASPSYNECQGMNRNDPQDVQRVITGIWGGGVGQPIMVGLLGTRQHSGTNHSASLKGRQPTQARLPVI